MEVGTDLYSAFCVSEESEPVHGEEKEGLGIAMQIIGFLWGEKMANGKRVFIVFFKCSIYPSSFRGFISVLYQEGNSKFKRKKKCIYIERELFEIASISVLSTA